MKKFYSLSVAALLSCVSCSAAGNAEQGVITPAAGGGDITHINTAGWADSPYISPDGQNLYFMYSRYNFFPTFTGGSPVLSGPVFPGHHNNDVNPYWDSDIYVSHRKADGTWGAPVNMPGVNDDKDNCCAMVVSTPPARIYYQKETGKGDRDLIYRDISAGSAGAIQFFPPSVNSAQNEDNPHVSADHRRIYFTSDRSGGEGKNDIWFSFADAQGKWSDAINVGAMINTGADEDQYWMADAPDSSGKYEVYFNRDSEIMRSTWSETEGFTQPTKVQLGCDFAGEASLTADGKELYFASGDPATKSMKIMVSRRNPDGSWGAAQPVD